MALSCFCNKHLFLENTILISAEQRKGFGPKRRTNVSSGFGVVMSAGEQEGDAEELVWCREGKRRQGWSRTLVTHPLPPKSSTHHSSSQRPCLAPTKSSSTPKKSEMKSSYVLEQPGCRQGRVGSDLSLGYQLLLDQKHLLNFSEYPCVMVKLCSSQGKPWPQMRFCS